MTVRRLGTGLRTDTRCRTVPEDRIIGLLQLGGYAYAGSGEMEARAALSVWVEQGLVFREGPMGQRCFDPVEVVNFFRIAGLAGHDDFWSRRWITTGRRLVEDLPRSIEGQRFVVDHQRIIPRPEGSAATRLRAPLPLLGEHLRDLEIDITVDGPASARMSPGRIEARPTGTGTVTLRSRSHFIATPYRERPPAEALSSVERAIYLRPREGLIVVSDQIAALARRLAGGGTAPRRAVALFWNLIIDELICGAIHYDQIDIAAPCDWALGTGLVDCQLGSALLIALCRAIELPARLVGGHLLYGRAPTNHYWAEIWFDETGWTPFDLLSWDLSRGGQDTAWRNRFFAALDPRMTTQRMPLEFTGAVGVPIPTSWHLVQSGTPSGVSIDLLEQAGRTIYRDLVSVQRCAAAPG